MLVLLKIWPNSILVADKHVFLGEILSMSGKYNEAVEEIEQGIARYEHGFRNEQETKRTSGNYLML